MHAPHKKENEGEQVCTAAHDLAFIFLEFCRSWTPFAGPGSFVLLWYPPKENDQSPDHNRCVDPQHLHSDSPLGGK